MVGWGFSVLGTRISLLFIMIIKKLIVGDIQTNCYMVADENTFEAAIIDPGGEVEAIEGIVRASKFIPRCIISTHGHFDHVLGVKKLQKSFQIPFYLHKEDSPMVDGSHSRLAASMGIEVDSLTADKFLADGDIISVGKIRLKVIHTPGHSKGGICLYSDKVLFSGDTLFAGDVGRTDLVGGSTEELKNSLKKLFELPASTKVYPGHGPETDIRTEKERWRGKL